MRRVRIQYGSNGVEIDSILVIMYQFSDFADLLVLRNGSMTNELEIY